MKFAATILTLFLAAGYVSAHGTLLRIKIDGKTFQGNRIGGKGPSVIRTANSQDPNYGTNNPALTCGPGAGPAALTADVAPGSRMEFDWRTADGGIWPHNIGPMMTYMAACNGPCNKFNAANAQWFKIDQVGKRNDGTWFQNDLKNGKMVGVTLPSNIAPGEYLVQHTVLALHIASNARGAEFYPGCVQVKVGGSGTGKPSANELVKIPGAYKDNDKGILINAFTNAPYPFPGPAVSKLAGSGGPAPPPAPPTGGNGGNGNGNGNGNSGACKPNPKKRSINARRAANVSREAIPDVDDEIADETVDDDVVVEYLRVPRHYSRIMRRMAHLESSIH
jgi:hypothetical protein